MLGTFIGPQIVEADAFMSLEDGVPAESVLDLYPKLMAARRGAVQGFVSNASFHDIGTPADLLQTSLDLAAADGRPGAPRWGDDVVVDPSASVTRSVLWDHVRVGAGATLVECVVADGVEIPAGATYRRSAIVNDKGRLAVAKLDSIICVTSERATASARVRQRYGSAEALHRRTPRERGGALGPREHSCRGVRRGAAPRCA